MRDLVERLRAGFGVAYGAETRPSVALAPGRVNLIGEHTDYNDGFVLPMAIDRHVGIAFAPRVDGRVHAHALDFGESCCFDLDGLEPGSVDGWAGYIAGVLWALGQEGVQACGMDLVLGGDIPVGAGLSSSAALEMAVARTQCELTGTPWEPKRMALIGQRAERDFVGVACGIMDQFASAVSAEGCALLLDCRTLETKAVPLPHDTTVVVMDTGVKRELAASAYNERHAQCQAALERIRASHPEARALRDASPEMLAPLRGSMQPVLFRRAQHVIEESARPAAMAEAFETGHLLRAGRLMSDSHGSLRDLYEVSCEELDWIVQQAEFHPGCYGARLTGAGFGGCAVALVRRSEIDHFIEAVGQAYRTRFDHPSALYACEPAAGAHVVAGAPVVA